MPRSAATPEDDDPVLAEDDEEPSPPPKRKPAARHRRSDRSRSGVKAWDDPVAGAADSDADGKDDDDDEAPEKERETVYYRARDAWWFEPLVAMMVIVVLLVALFAYTANWPPVYVVESESMQHGYDDRLGLINTGDLVLAQKINTPDITTYIAGMQSGYSTYGEYGDVVLYHPYDNLSEAPIIHRAIVWVDYNPNGSYSVPSLNGLPCGNASNAVYSVSDHASGCGPIGLKGVLSLFHIGWMSVEVDVPMDPSILGRHSGFITMGDNNFDGANTSAGVTDQVGQLSTLVDPSWILGVARGMIPWFGALKLALDGTDQEVPSQSWTYLGLTVVVIFLAGLGLHLFLRREGFEDERRKRQEEEEERERRDAADSEDDGAKKKSGGKRRGLHLWGSDDDEADPPPAPVRAGKRSRSPPSADAGDGTPATAPPKRRRGRPVPSIGRSPPADDASDDAL